MKRRKIRSDPFSGTPDNRLVLSQVESLILIVIKMSWIMRILHQPMKLAFVPFLVSTCYRNSIFCHNSINPIWECPIIIQSKDFGCQYFKIYEVRSIQGKGERGASNLTSFGETFRDNKCGAKRSKSKYIQGILNSYGSLRVKLCFGRLKIRLIEQFSR